SNDKWYYLDAEGVMKTGWYQDGEKWFYLDPSAEGAKKVGWAEVNGKWYYLDPTTDGSMKTGWVQVNGQWYYLDGNKGGMMVTGQVDIDGKTYVFADDGQLKSEVASKADKIITEAKKHIGKPYVWGATGPNSFDCSGFVYYAFNHAGYPMSRTTAQGLYDKSQKITNPQPGDLVFLHSTYPGGPYITHVGIHIGDGKMIQAGDKGVEIQSLNSPYNLKHFAGYGRI
ncbi:NlpC/P60 family protein, partial [Bacillus cereus]|nr:NlpC/P60 family protein [Bacillus cereus]